MKKYKSGWLMDNNKSISFGEAFAVAYANITGKNLKEVMFKWN